MKKIFVTAAILAGIFLCSCKKLEHVFTSTPLTSKSIDLSLYKNISYNAPVYNNVSATVQVTITKISKGERKVIWQHNYGPKQLKQYATSTEPWLQKIHIRNINDKKDKFEVSYLLMYNVKGTMLNLTSDTLLVKGKENQAISISV